MISNQELLVQQLKHIFPNEKPLVNSRKQSQIKYSIEGSHYLELDLWFPRHNICFEFQDEYHYVTTWYNQNSLSQVQAKDSNKRERVNKLGMNLIAIPCWWDGEIASLSATINFHCPALILAVDVDPIPLNPPFKFFKTHQVPEVGELMFVSFPEKTLTLTHNTWWLGEKYDGIRCCWNPSQRKVYSRFGNELDILPEISLSLPKNFVDGEFWYGRSSFLYAFMITKRVPDFNAWCYFRITAFDAPAPKLQNKPFEYRYKVLLDIVPSENPVVIVVPRMLFQFSSSPRYFIQMIIDDGGEGIILRKVGSVYQHGRSRELLKLKTSTGDAEAIVIGFKQKSVLLQLPDGKTFKVTPENVHIRKVSVGDVVSFSFDTENSQNVLAKSPEPKIYRLRSDISWANVVSLHNKEQKKDLSDTSLRYVNLKTTAAKSGRRDLIKKMRHFLSNFAKSKKLDPHQLKTWQQIKESELAQHKRGKMILAKYKTALSAAKSLFPIFRKIDLWKVAENRRKFFENFAKEHGFDPLSSEAWYSQPSEKILSAKGATQVLYYYNLSISRALISLFPEIGLNKSKKWEFWLESAKIRRIFENYAKEQGFDPLVATNWYEQPKSKLMGMKGIGLVYSRYAGDVTKALQDLFPETGIDPSKLTTVSWLEEKKRREFFETYARENKFDPLIPENWYAQSPKNIKAIKGGARIVAYHGNSIAKALLDLFPEIGLDDMKLISRSWSEPSNRRRFFERYAKNHSFDPLNPENWYAQSQNKILVTKGAHRIVTFHNGSIARALIDLFTEVNFPKTTDW
eukprot:Phypoly_transcript_00814.p1 GENE.Phypoly_transcript_00814~~Phypoly_transcript_00814.p1  ORF type:complete len:797 (+),score=105.00 Phypoly_transcript_00814:1557-3947(+)